MKLDTHPAVELHSDTMIFGSGSWKAGEYLIGDELEEIPVALATLLVERGQATFVEENNHGS